MSDESDCGYIAIVDIRNKIFYHYPTSQQNHDEVFGVTSLHAYMRTHGEFRLKCDHLGWYMEYDVPTYKKITTLRLTLWIPKGYVWLYHAREAKKNPDLVLVKSKEELYQVLRTLEL